jgi:hypothetical protein
MRLAIVLSILLTASLPAPSLAQKPLTISVDVGGVAGDIIGSLIKRELRKSSDVRIVEEDQSPDVVLAGVAMCEGECVSTNAYILSLQIQRIPGSTFAEGVLILGGFIPTRAKADSAALGLSALRMILNYTIHLWPRRQVDEAVVSYVAKLDAKCFEKLRLARQPLPPRADSAAYNARYKRLFAEDWIC